MNRTAAALLFTAIASLAHTSAQTISVHVYNSAHVPKRTLDAALLETARIFETAGVTVTWRLDLPVPNDWSLDMSQYPTSQTDPRPYLVLSIVTNFPNTIYQGALGFALPFAHTGPHATLFYNRIETAARLENTALETALGEAIAHELGHDLLRSEAHSRSGLMQARWDRSAWQFASRGLLAFLPREQASIRATARILEVTRETVAR